MSVSNETNKVRATANGSQTAFPFSFKIFLKGDLEVYTIVRSTGVATLLTVDTDYTVAINSITEGGTVTLLVAPASTKDVLIKRVLDYTQPTVIPTESNFPEKSVENELDRGRMVDIQLKEEIDRTLRIPATADDSDFDGEMPDLTGNAGKLVVVNATEDGFEYREGEGTPGDTGPAGPTGATGPAGSAGPIFSATKAGSDQTGVVTATWTKVTFTTEESDTNSNFAGSAFTPTVAGKYLLTSFVLFDIGVDQAVYQLAIYKNGTIHRMLDYVCASGTGAVGLTGATIVSANGSTDYFEVYAIQNSGSDKIILGPGAQTQYPYFQGHFIGV